MVVQPGIRFICISLLNFNLGYVKTEISNTGLINTEVFEDAPDKLKNEYKDFFLDRKLRKEGKKIGE